jgi:glycosyltransferase A (GT-A) superfamily protein (DUF2064 family)
MLYSKSKTPAYGDRVQNQRVDDQPGVMLLVMQIPVCRSEEVLASATAACRNSALVLGDG